MNEDFVRDTAAPVIEYSDSLKDTQKIKAGKSLILSVNIRGSPTPKASWWRNDAEVKSGLDVTVEGDGTFSRLTVKNTSGDVTGKYKVLAENSVGSDSAEFNVVILGQFNCHHTVIVAAQTVWNSLPPHVRSCTTLTTFRKHLKSHLFQSSFPTALRPIPSPLIHFDLTYLLREIS